MTERVLAWDGCVNVRDLGGLPTEDGGVTLRGAVVRSDNARRLTGAGWQALLDHGVRTVLDLRWADEREEDPPGDVPIETVHVSLLGEPDPGYAADLDTRLQHIADTTDRTRTVYLEFMRRHPDRFAEAVAAVAEAQPGGVLVHCAAGKDRTGLIVALLLRLAGVDADTIAEDYAESEVNLARLTGLWIAEATDEEERQRRIHMSRTPKEAMLGVLDELERSHGGARGYLLAAGATEEQLARARARLRGAA